MRRYEDSFKVVKESYETRKKAFGEEDSDTIAMHIYLALNYILLKDFQAAYEVDKENYEIQKRIYGEDSSMGKATLYRMEIEKKKAL